MQTVYIIIQISITQPYVSTIYCRIYLIKYDHEFVILLVNLLVRLTVFRCFSVFHPLWLVLFHTVDVNIFS